MVSPEVLHLEVPLSSVMPSRPMSYSSGMSESELGFYPSAYYPDYQQYPQQNLYGSPYMQVEKWLFSCEAAV